MLPPFWGPRGALAGPCPLPWNPEDPSPVPHWERGNHSVGPEGWPAKECSRMTRQAARFSQPQTLSKKSTAGGEEVCRSKDLGEGTVSRSPPPCPSSSCEPNSCQCGLMGAPSEGRSWHCLPGPQMFVPDGRAFAGSHANPPHTAHCLHSLKRRRCYIHNCQAAGPRTEWQEGGAQMWYSVFEWFHRYRTCRNGV